MSVNRHLRPQSWTDAQAARWLRQARAKRKLPEYAHPDGEDAGKACRECGAPIRNRLTWCPACIAERNREQKNEQGRKQYERDSAYARSTTTAWTHRPCKECGAEVKSRKKSRPPTCTACRDKAKAAKKPPERPMKRATCTGCGKDVVTVASSASPVCLRCRRAAKLKRAA